MERPRLRALPDRLGAPQPRADASGVEAITAQSDRRSRGGKHTARWQRLRRRVLERDGWICQQTGVMLVAGRTAPNAAVVDHIIPHRGNPALFWDENNLQSVSKAWHDSKKQSMEKTGRV